MTKQLNDTSFYQHETVSLLGPGLRLVMTNGVNEILVE